ncbi:tol-pal system protein YbgF [Desulfovibrio sp. TomC]|uniref:tol-pal system protein YbgF n=1 Tax=Desulfovibrio sp. TomC TaxID=1562888 RepID=UPI000574F101|nr:tol-pal system protein YbgF [Desulfovibrio sp. TomC]KHK02287.1 hypothetical protein NY78_2418 [Desulfovibrio sp. TomC]
MKRTTLLMGLVALCLTGLLGACGPGNTLAVGKGSEDFRLKAIEANLQKAQDDLKALSGQQQQNDAKLADIHKQLGAIRTVLEGQGVKLPAPGARGSALGVGFAHPGEAVAPEPATAAAAAAEPSPAVPGAPGPGVPGAPGGHSPAMGAPAGQPNGLPPRPAPAAATRSTPPPSAAEMRGRHGGRVGPPETPATPEAAIAADRVEAGPGPRPATAPVATAQAPAAAQATPPSPTVPTAAPAAAAPSPVAAETPPGPKAEEPAATPGSKGSGPAPGYADTATPAQKAEYNRALQLAINGRAAEAKAAFDQFLAANPASPLTPNALYWVGEGAFARGDYQTAIADFDKVAKGWPGHHKAADSLYKMAMAQEKAGDVPAARASLERYLKDYPNAELAGVARQKLQALPK